jgi:hypothetical protein
MHWNCGHRGHRLERARASIHQADARMAFESIMADRCLFFTTAANAAAVSRQGRRLPAVEDDVTGDPERQVGTIRQLWLHGVNAVSSPSRSQGSAPPARYT